MVKSAHMEKMTRREMISSAAFAAGVIAIEGLTTGCSDSLRNEKMIYRPLGKTGLEVRVIGFGA